MPKNWSDWIDCTSRAPPYPFPKLRNDSRNVLPPCKYSRRYNHQRTIGRRKQYLPDLFYIKKAAQAMKEISRWFRLAQELSRYCCQITRIDPCPASWNTRFTLWFISVNKDRSTVWFFLGQRPHPSKTEAKEKRIWRLQPVSKDGLNWHSDWGVLLVSLLSSL